VALPPEVAGLSRVEVVVDAVGLSRLDRERGAEALPLETLVGRRVGLLAAIARPERFEAMVLGLGVGAVVHRAFHRDHAFLSEAALVSAFEAARSAGAELVLTTEKDAVRCGTSLAAVGLRRRAPPWPAVLAIAQRIARGGEQLEAALDGLAIGRRSGG
jgi:tetraacyldisaccharide-1-P 4'-kinase